MYIDQTIRLTDFIDRYRIAMDRIGHSCSDQRWSGSLSGALQIRVDFDDSNYDNKCPSTRFFIKGN